jgi:predicted nucleic acid-binding Zn ribbon protein
MVTPFIIPKCACGKDCVKPKKPSTTSALNYGYSKTCGNKDCVLKLRTRKPRKTVEKKKGGFKGGLSITAQRTSQKYCYRCGEIKEKGKIVCKKCKEIIHNQNRYVNKQIFLDSIDELIQLDQSFMDGEKV